MLLWIGSIRWTTLSNQGRRSSNRTSRGRIGEPAGNPALACSRSI